MKIPDLSSSSPEEERQKRLTWLKEEMNKLLQYSNLKKLSLEGYKVFEAYQPFAFPPLTLLTGQNSSGKSSLLELIKILHTNTNLDRLNLYELAEKVGSFEKVITRSKSEKEFTVCIGTSAIDLSDDLTLTLTYRLSPEKRQQCELCYYRLENEEDILLELKSSKDQLLSGYVNFPLLWQRFKHQFQEHAEQAKDKQSISYYFSKNFFKETAYDFVASDFDELPPFYLANTIVGCNEDLLDAFVTKYRLTDKNLIASLDTWEKKLFESFHFADVPWFYEEGLLHNFTEEVFNPFNYFINRSREAFSDDPGVNPLKELLEHVDYGKTKRNQTQDYYDLTTASPFELPDYLQYYGMSEEDYQLIADNNKRWSKYEHLEEDRFSADAKELVRQLVRKEQVRRTFCQFIQRNFKSTFNYLLPEVIFIPVIRSQQKIVLQNLSTRHSYDNFLQQAAVTWQELSDYKQSRITTVLSKAIDIFDLGESIRIDTDAVGLLNIWIIKDNQEFNIAEEGFGISQLFSLILALCVYKIAPLNERDMMSSEAVGDDYFSETMPLICIEEPESNLHPNFQSKLADLFAYLIKKLKVQLLIETHSEYLIRRLRYLTAVWYRGTEEDLKAGVPKEFWKVYYFNRKEKVSLENPRVYDIQVIDDKGTVNREFGEGFLDIATQIELDYIDLISPKNNN